MGFHLDMPFSSIPLYMIEARLSAETTTTITFDVVAEIPNAELYLAPRAMFSQVMDFPVRKTGESADFGKFFYMPGVVKTGKDW